MTTLCANFFMSFMKCGLRTVVKKTQSGQRQNLGRVSKGCCSSLLRDVLRRDRASPTGALLPRAVRQVIKFTEGDDRLFGYNNTLNLVMLRQEEEQAYGIKRVTAAPRRTSSGAEEPLREGLVMELLSAGTVAMVATVDGRIGDVRPSNVKSVAIA
ncbi:hypothetical protein BC827DRAFT_1157109 [Russula dissimulans]|nr:hypothetical protein BC827DRAFT_1157109 [Russula dissimulans]